MTSSRRLWLLVLATLAGPAAAAAQDVASDTLPEDSEGVRVRGVVVDRTSGRALPAASVRLVDLVDGGRLAWEGASDSSGVFVGPRLSPSRYRIRVEALGYRPAADSLEVSGYGDADVRVELTPVAVEMEPLVVVTRMRSRLELAGFYDRRRLGFGRSLTREEILARSPLSVTDLFRGMAGVTVSRSSLGRGGLIQMRGGCVPDVVLDGVRLTGPVRLDDILAPGDLEGIEIYSGSASPVGYSHSPCGTILAWSRDPEPTPGRSWSWGRVATTAGFAVLSLFLVFR